MGPAPHRVRLGAVRSVDRQRGEFTSRRARLGDGGAGPVSLFGFWRRGGREPAIRRAGRPRSALGLFGVWGGGLEVPGPGPVYRLVGPAAATPPGADGQQYPLSDFALGEGAAFGQLDFGPGQPPDRRRLAGQVWTCAWCCWRPLWSGSVFGARRIGRPTGWRWAPRRGAPGRTGTPAFKRRSKTFISIRCGGTFGRRCQA